MAAENRSTALQLFSVQNMEKEKSGLNGSRRRPGGESALEVFHRKVFFFGTSSGGVRFSEGMTRVRIDFA
jgi:hypothetical protein